MRQSRPTLLAVCSAFPTRSDRPTDPPRAARRRKFWVGNPDRPTLFDQQKRVGRRLLAVFSGFRPFSAIPTRPTDPLPTNPTESMFPTDRPTLGPTWDARKEINFAPPGPESCEGPVRTPSPHTIDSIDSIASAADGFIDADRRLTARLHKEHVNSQPKRF